MPEHQVPWLCQRTVRRPEHQHRRCPERPYQEHIVRLLKFPALQQADCTYTYKSADKSPQMVYRFYYGLAVYHVTGNAVPPFYFLSQIMAFSAAKLGFSLQILL